MPDEKRESKEKEHDLRIARHFDTILPEVALESFMARLLEENLFYSDDRAALVRYVDTGKRYDYRFLSKTLADCHASVLSAFQALLSFMALNFFLHRVKESGERQMYRLHPDKNIDLSNAVSSDDAALYVERQEALGRWCQSAEVAYSAYRRTAQDVFGTSLLSKTPEYNPGAGEENNVSDTEHTDRQDTTRKSNLEDQGKRNRLQTLQRLGAGLGVAIVGFVMLLVLTPGSLLEGKHFLVVVLVAILAALTTAILGGTATAKGELPLAPNSKNTIAISMSGAIAAFFICLIMGNRYYPEPAPPGPASPQPRSIVFVGRILESTGSAVVNGEVTIDIVNVADPIRQWTDSNGEYKVLISPESLSQRDYVVRVRAAGYQPREEHHSFPVSGAHLEDIHLARSQSSGESEETTKSVLDNVDQDWDKLAGASASLASVRPIAVERTAGEVMKTLASDQHPWEFGDRFRELFLHRSLPPAGWVGKVIELPKQKGKVWGFAVEETGSRSRFLVLTGSSVDQVRPGVTVRVTGVVAGVLTASPGMVIVSVPAGGLTVTEHKR